MTMENVQWAQQIKDLYWPARYIIERVADMKGMSPAYEISVAKLAERLGMPEIECRAYIVVARDAGYLAANEIDDKGTFVFSIPDAPNQGR